MGDTRRIRINLTSASGMSYEELRREISKMLEERGNVSDAFSTVLTSIFHLNGGVGNLADAANDVDNRRVQTDNTAVQAAENAAKQIGQFIQSADSTDRKVAQLSVAEQEKIELQKNTFAAMMAQMNTAAQKKFLAAIKDEAMRRDIEERMRRAVLAQMEWDLQRYKAQKRQEREESGFRLAPQTYMEGVFRNVGDKWAQWGTEGGWGTAKKIGLSAAALAAFALLTYLSGGTVAFEGGAAALKSALIFGAVGGVTSGSFTALQGGSWEDVFINAGIGFGLGAVGGAGFGWGLAIHSGAVVFTSGALTSGAGSVIAAMRSGDEIDAELFAEIYTKAMLSGTIDLALGKLLTFISSKPIGYTAKGVTRELSDNFKYVLDAEKFAKAFPRSNTIGGAQIGDEILVFHYKTVPDFVGKSIKPQFGGTVSDVKLNGPISMTFGKSFTIPVAWSETTTDAFRTILSVETMKQMQQIYNFGKEYRAPLPSAGDMVSRGIIDRDNSGIVLDTFFIPEPKKY
ncbi:MAG: hypothetical protein IJ598_01210 [Ruminococcus sp.]|nr:hypothetical protein [Ruminococcus sp.]